MNDNNKSKSIKSQYGKIHKEDIISLQGCSGSDVLTYMVLLYHASIKRISYPSCKRIVSFTGLSRGSVMRSIRRLKDKNIIEPVGYTLGGVVKYQLPCISSDTPPCNKSDTGCNEADTSPCNESDTPPCNKSDTSPVSKLIPITEKITEKKNNLLIANTADEKLFCLLWDKWNDDALCKWESIDALQDYLLLKEQVLNHWQTNSIKKELCFELQIIDIFLLEQKELLANKSYTGEPRLWAKRNWFEGLIKWLKSPTPSRISPNRKKFIPHCIKLNSSTSEPEQKPQKNEHKDDSDNVYIEDLLSLYGLLDDCEDMNSEEGYRAMHRLFLAHYEKTPFPDRFRSDSRFYEYFHTIDRFLKDETYRKSLNW